MHSHHTLYMARFPCTRPYMLENSALKARNDLLLLCILFQFQHVLIKVRHKQSVLNDTIIFKFSFGFCLGNLCSDFACIHNSSVLIAPIQFRFPIQPRNISRGICGSGFNPVTVFLCFFTVHVLPKRIVLNIFKNFTLMIRLVAFCVQ